MQVANAVRQETYKKNADVLDGIEWLSTLDGRTTPLCQALDGKQFDMELNPIDHDMEYPGGPPCHFQCRSTTLPLLKSWNELIGPQSKLNKKQIDVLENMPKGMRDTINGPIPMNMNYNEWLLTQPINIQQEILGKGKWKLWSENKLSVSDLVNNQGKPLTIKELSEKLGVVYEEAVIPVVEGPVSIAEKLAAEIAEKEAELMAAIKDADSIVTFVPEQSLPASLYIPVKGAIQAVDDNAKTVYGKLKIEIDPTLDTPFVGKPGLKKSAGMIVVDGDTGKIWVNSPKNQFGGYKATFPKGTAELQLPMQEVGIKEVFEETGLQAKPLFHLGDYEKTTSITRYYVGVKTGGSPAMMGWESEAVNLVPIHKLEGFMNVVIDKKIAKDFKVIYEKALKLGDGDFKVGLKVLQGDMKAGIEFAELTVKYPDLMIKGSAIFAAGDTVTQAAKLKAIKSWMDEVAETSLKTWRGESGTVAATVYKSTKLTGNILDDYTLLTKKIKKVTEGYNDSLIKLVEHNTNAKAAYKKLIDEKIIFPNSDPSVAFSAVIRESNSYNNQYLAYFQNIEKGTLKGEAYELLTKKGANQLRSLDDLSKIKKIDELSEQLKSVYIEKINKLNQSAVGQEALRWGKANGIDWKDLYDNKPKKWIETMEDIIQTGKYKTVQVEVGSANGKLVADLSTKEKAVLDILDESMKDPTWEWIDAGPAFKKDSTELWRSLDSSVKQSLMKGWNEVGVSPPSAWMGDTEKKLWKAIGDLPTVTIKVEPGALNGKLIVDLTKRESAILAEGSNTLILKGKYIPTKEFTELWDSLDSSVKQKYFDFWVKEKLKIPSELLGTAEKKLVVALDDVKRMSGGYTIKTVEQFNKLPDQDTGNAIKNMDKFHLLKIDPRLIKEDPYIISNKISKEFKEILIEEKYEAGNPSWKEFYVKKFGGANPLVQPVVANKPLLVSDSYKITTFDQYKAIPMKSIKNMNDFYALKIDPKFIEFDPYAIGHKLSDEFKTIINMEKTNEGTFQDLYKNKFGGANPLVRSVALEQKAVVDVVPSRVAVGELDFKDMVKYKEQAGSNTGGYYHKVDNTAERYYIKTPANDAIADNEMLASKLYQAAGVEVPDLKYIQVNGKKSIASTIVDGLEDNKKLLTSGKLRAGVYDDFAVDAWLGNWDVVGLNYDNLLIKNGVRAVRIDVGGALEYRAMGTAKGLDFGKEVIELKSLLDPRVNPQSASIFKKIKKAELEVGVRKVLAVPDEDIRRLVQTYGSGTISERNYLADKLIARKKYLQKQFPDIDAEKAITKVSTKTRIAPTEYAKLDTSARINGIQIPSDVDGIEDRRIAIWLEKSKDGNNIGMIQMKLREAAAKKMDDLVAKAAGAGNYYDTAGLHEDMATALRGIAMQSRSGAALRTKDIERVSVALKKYYDDLSNLLSSKGKYAIKEVSELQEHYAPWIKFLEKAKEVGEGGKLKWDLDSTFKNTFTQFRGIKAVAEKADESAVIFVKKPWEILEKKFEKGYAKRTGNIVRTYEHQFETEVDGIKFQYWPNDAEISFANRGMLKIEVPSGKSVDMEKALDILQKRMGVNTARATDEQLEALYLRQIAYARNQKKCYDLIDKVEKLETDAEKIKAYKKELNKIVGYDISKSPVYDYKGKANIFDVGKNSRIRPDLEGDAWEKVKNEYGFGHRLSIDPDDFANQILDNGSEMTATTDKFRKGFNWGGQSPGSDMKSGGASTIFLRFKRMNDLGDCELVWKGGLAARQDLTFYPHDYYGCFDDVYARREHWILENEKIASKRIGTPEDWIKDQVTEVIAKQSLSIFDSNFDYWYVKSDTTRDRIIQMFKDRGYTKWPDGRQLEDVIVSSRIR
jgi:hypothetical protein